MIIWDEALMMHFELSKLLIGPYMIWCNWMMHRQPRRSLVGKLWSLVGIFDRSCLLFPREDKKTLSMFHCLNCIFGSMLRFFVFISTCESWQPILKSNESLPNGCWMLKMVVFLPLHKKKVSIQIGSRFCPYEATNRRLQLKRITPNHLSRSPMPFWRCHVSYATQHWRWWSQQCNFWITIWRIAHVLECRFFGSDRRRCKCCYRSFNGFIVSGGIFKHYVIQQYHKS